MAEERKPFWAKCGSCNHCWPAAYLPMELAAAAKLMMKASCPMCGNGPKGKGVFVAKQNNGVLNEPAGAAGA